MFLICRAISNKNVIAILVFVSFIKLFKYISFNKTMTQLSTTLSKVSYVVINIRREYKSPFSKIAKNQNKI